MCVGGGGGGGGGWGGIIREREKERKGETAKTIFITLKTD